MSYLYDPDDKDLVEILQEFPEFKRSVHPLPELMVFRYIIFMYDFGSPFRKKIPDYLSRKRESATQAGFTIDKKKRKFDSSVEEMLIGDHDVVNNMIIKYIRLFNVPDYLNYIISWELMLKEMRFAMSATDSKAAKESRANMQALTAEIKELEVLIFGGEETENTRRALYASMEAERLRLRPEEISEDMLAKKMVVRVDGHGFGMPEFEGGDDEV